MPHSIFLKTMALALFSTIASGTAEASEEAAKPSIRYYELRTYHTNPGKLEALHARFRDRTMALFTKHGMTNVGYWVPKDNPDQLLIYLLSYPDKVAREKSWADFQADPDWVEAKAASEKDGVLVNKVDSRFLTMTDFSPQPKATAEGAPHAFELRTYTTTPGNLPLLLKRFREHTLALFAQHGMTNFVYFTPAAGEPGADNTLVYLLQHPSAEKGVENLAAFRADPEWIKVKDASEKEGGGSLTVPDGVVSLMLLPTDYSPVK